MSRSAHDVLDGVEPLVRSFVRSFVSKLTVACNFDFLFSLFSPIHTHSHLHAVVDEKLYSRQLYVLGQDGQRNMMKSSCMVIGCSGLGGEVCKDIILASEPIICTSTHEFALL